MRVARQRDELDGMSRAREREREECRARGRHLHGQTERNLAVLAHGRSALEHAGPPCTTRSLPRAQGGALSLPGLQRCLTTLGRHGVPLAV